ncbi:MAG: hypothetical protein FWC26_03180 [Fibromonadales bacterium]|nr:hypothetical protein [Fibromonadales bacterium]
MTSAQLERNRNAGLAKAKKYPHEHYVAIGRKGGLQPKKIVYQPLEKINEGRRPASYSELLKAVFSMPNLKEGGLRVSRNTVYPITG